MNIALLSSYNNLNVFAALRILHTKFEFTDQRMRNVGMQNETAPDQPYGTLLHLWREYARLRRELDELDSRRVN